MSRRVIRERVVGHRVIAGTKWPVTDTLVRVQVPGRRVAWEFVIGLCNGVPFGVRSFGLLRDALMAYESRRYGNRELS